MNLCTTDMLTEKESEQIAFLAISKWCLEVILANVNIAPCRNPKGPSQSNLPKPQVTTHEKIPRSWIPKSTDSINYSDISTWTCHRQTRPLPQPWLRRTEPPRRPTRLRRSQTRCVEVVVTLPIHALYTSTGAVDVAVYSDTGHSYTARSRLLTLTPCDTLI